MYQCVIVNAMRLKTETAYVTLEKDTLSYQVSSRQPDYFYLPGPYYVSSPGNGKYLCFVDSIEYDIIGEGSQILTNQMRESTVFSLLIG